MRYRIASLFVALLFAAPLVADANKDRMSEFNALRAKYQNEAFDKKPNPKDYLPQLLKLIEADPKDELSLNMLVWGVQRMPTAEPRLYELLAEYHAKDPKIAGLVDLLLKNDAKGSEKLLQKVLADNPKKDVQGRACLGLALRAGARMENGDQKAADEAEKYYERMAKDFADVKYDRTTLGEIAQGPLFEIRHLSVGKTAPNIESENLDGKKVQLKDYRGKVVVLDIWATWCGPCKAMIPHEKEMVKKLQDKPFTLISISVDDKKEAAKEFVEKEKMAWVHWWDGQNTALKDWNIQYIPAIYVLDTKGVIRYKGVRGEELEKAVEELLKEAKK
jgi:thiol-disulfide isomerase/thioredoxin